MKTKKEKLHNVPEEIKDANTAEDFFNNVMKDFSDAGQRVIAIGPDGPQMVYEGGVERALTDADMDEYNDFISGFHFDSVIEINGDNVERLLTDDDIHWPALLCKLGLEKMNEKKPIADYTRDEFIASYEHYNSLARRIIDKNTRTLNQQEMVNKMQKMLLIQTQLIRLLWVCPGFSLEDREESIKNYAGNCIELVESIVDFMGNEETKIYREEQVICYCMKAEYERICGNFEDAYQAISKAVRLQQTIVKERFGSLKKAPWDAESVRMLNDILGTKSRLGKLVKFDEKSEQS